MAAYAALVTLINLMEDMQNHPRLSASLDNKQIQSLAINVHFLLNFIETYSSHGGSKETQDLERQIASAAQEAEDVVESHIVHQILAADEKIQSKDDKSCLQEVIEQMDSIKKKMMKIGIEAGSGDEPLPVLATSSRPRKMKMVGFEEEQIHLMNLLTAPQLNHQFISIVGMGGAGKTTLTANAFENPLIEQRFGSPTWVKVSQDHSARDILLELLYYEKSRTETDNELGERLYKYLSCQRYLIVLDDMWSVDAWDEIKIFFPDNGSRGRVVVTTRLLDLGRHVSSSCIVMKFLDKDDSWKLFCEKAFGEDACPPELEEVGKEIVELCQGLPLSIVLIGGYLSKSSRSKEHWDWEYIATWINSNLYSGRDEQCLRILSLSYSRLPVHLKPCFLYMGVFGDDQEIFVGQIIRLWVAEGFLKPNAFQTLEEIGESYFNDLVDRSLVLVHRLGDNGKFIYCKVHDLVRELCLKEAEKEKFYRVLKLLDSDTPRSINRERRVAIHGGPLDEDFCESSLFEAIKSAPLLRSFICVDTHNHPFDFRLLKVQNTVSDYPDKVDADCLGAKFHQQVNLRYLSQNIYSGEYPYPFLHLPPSISLLWNLQTLILSGTFEGVVMPLEIWEMPQLRHLDYFDMIYLPDPPPSDQQRRVVLQNLQTLKKVGNLRLSDEVCKRIPNIKVLHVWYGVSWITCSYNFGRLHKLESLTCSFDEQRISLEFVSSLIFPSSLRELCLTRCLLHWEDLRKIGSLPFLEVLELGLAVKGREWSLTEGEFRRLRHLKIWCWDDLVNWNAGKYNFPVLENLSLRSLAKLGEIPLGIGEIPKLLHIKLDDCSVSSAVSAMRILVERESLGDESLQLEVRFTYQDDHRSFMEMVQEEGLNSNNLLLRQFYKVGEKKSEGIEKAKSPNKQPKRLHQTKECIVASSDLKRREKGKRKIGFHLNFEVLKLHFGKKLKDVAEELGVGRSTIKRACREYGIDRWPSKQKHNKNPSLFERERGREMQPSTSNLQPLDKITENSASHHVIAEEEADKVIVKVKYEEDLIKFELCVSLGLETLIEEVATRLNLEKGSFKLKYLDEDGDEILLTIDNDLQHCPRSRTTTGNTCIRLLGISHFKDLLTDLNVEEEGEDKGEIHGKFELSLSLRMARLFEEVGTGQKVEDGYFQIEILDEDNDEILVSRPRC